MRIIHFQICLIIVSLFPKWSSAQNNGDTAHFTRNVEPSVHYYKSGNVQWRGQNLCERFKGGGGLCFPIGFRDYWYESGQLEIQDFTSCDSLNYKYSCRKLINMWLTDGKQILKNGNGFFYEVSSYGNRTDSMFVEIKDSLKNGNYKHYRKHDNERYALLEWGIYKNSKRIGVFYHRDSLSHEFEDKTYETGREICYYRFYTENYTLKEEGTRVEGFKEGLWKYYDGYGVVLKEINYTKGSKYGEYKEYYSNGRLSVWGLYDHAKNFDPSGYGNRGNLGDDNSIPGGQWKYYTKKGKLKKVETH